MAAFKWGKQVTEVGFRPINPLLIEPSSNTKPNSQIMASLTETHGHDHTPVPMTSSSVQNLGGSITVPGDKSISHRSLLLGAVADGQTRVSGLFEADDVMAKVKAIKAAGMQAQIEALKAQLEAM